MDTKMDMSRVKIRKTWTKPYELEEENKQLKREIRRLKKELKTLSQDVQLLSLNELQRLKQEYKKWMI